MLGIVASIFTKNRAPIERRWRQEGGLPSVAGTRINSPLTGGPVQTPPGVVLECSRPDFRFVADGELGPASLGDAAGAGCLVVFDGTPKQLVWESSWGNLVYTPSGFCFGDDVMYVSDLEGSSVFEVDLVHQRGRLLRRISHPYMNDLHGSVRTRRGLLLASAGTDVVLELDLEGRLLYEWWAAEHGYDVSPSGHRRAPGRHREHRDRYYHTRVQTTHLNGATFRDQDERLMVVVLFHQGQVVQVDREAPPGTRPTVLVDKLARPHGLTRTAAGWLIASSAAAELIALSEDFEVTGRHRLAGAGWLQDVTVLSNGNVLVNDVDNHCLLELVPPDWRITERTVYDPNWRMAEIAELPRHLSEAFATTSAASPAAADR